MGRLAAPEHTMPRFRGLAFLGRGEGVPDAAATVLGVSVVQQKGGPHLHK